MKNLDLVLSHFNFDGAPAQYKSFGSGHINGTYLVTTSSGTKYIVQSLSKIAFGNIPELMENIVAVTQFIAQQASDERSVLRCIPCKNGNYYYIDENEDYWRAYTYIDNTISLNLAETPEDFYQCAIAFGSFQKLLSKFPASTLHETIPEFHNTPDRYRKFYSSLAADKFNRRKNCESEISFLQKREAMAAELQKMREGGELPLRVTHNDTKLNNVLFDASTRKALCVIDLDTVMPGLIAYDFGDAIRFGASTAMEDERDLSKVSMSLDLFRSFTSGYLSSCEGLTPKEISTLSLGAKIITLEIGMRFLTDYLDGDIYFATEYDNHNLVRARTQFKLVADMENKWDQMEAIVSEESKRAFV